MCDIQSNLHVQFSVSSPPEVRIADLFTTEGGDVTSIGKSHSKSNDFDILLSAALAQM